MPTTNEIGLENLYPTGRTKSYLRTLTDEKKFKSFENLKREFDLENSDLFRYFQLRHFYNTDIENHLSQEGSELIDMITGAYRQLPSKIVSRLYKCLQNCNLV